MTKEYFADLIKDLTSIQLLKFLEYVYEEAQENVDFKEGEGFSSTFNFPNWLTRTNFVLNETTIRENILKEYNRIKETY